MNKYEFWVILDGEATTSKIKAVRERTEKLVTLFEGKVGKVEDLGKKPLAYKIKKLGTGYFLLFNLELPGKSIKALNSKLRMESDIIRYLLLKS
jgi:small subunit ribosomal protein S6